MKFQDSYIDELEKLGILQHFAVPLVAPFAPAIAAGSLPLAAGHKESKGKVIDAPNIFKRPISGILGRTASPLTAALLATKSPLTRGPRSTDKEIKQVLNVYKNNPHTKDTKVYLNHKPYIETVSRIIKNKRMSIPSKIFGLATSPISALSTSLGRSDHYDPHANAVTVYTKHPGILAHELGHAADFGKQKYPGIYSALYMVPFANLIHEGRANIEALRAIKKDKSLRKSKRISSILGGSYGSYVGSGLLEAANHLGKDTPLIPIPGLGAIPALPVASAWAGRGLGALARGISNWRERRAEAKKDKPRRSRALFGNTRRMALA